jgi:hypothetical protein
MESLWRYARGTLVEAAGQLIHLFRGGLDYAFILPEMGRSGASYPGNARILVPAQPLACSAGL